MPPRLEFSQGRFDFAEILLVIRAKIKTSPLPCPTGDGVEKVRLQQAVLVVPRLGPRIGKQDPNLFERGTYRECIEEFTRFSSQKGAIREVRTVPFFPAAEQTIQDDINPDAEFPGVFLRITHEKVTMSAPHFPHDAAWLRQQQSERALELCATFAHSRQKLGFISHAPESAAPSSLPQERSTQAQAGT